MKETEDTNKQKDTLCSYSNGTRINNPKIHMKLEKVQNCQNNPEGGEKNTAGGIILSDFR